MSDSFTSVGFTPGHCAWHGYHGMISCPKCSSAVPQPLPSPPPRQGWQCPVCGSIYAPGFFECFRCNSRPGGVSEGET